MVSGSEFVNRYEKISHLYARNSSYLSNYPFKKIIVSVVCLKIEKSLTNCQLMCKICIRKARQATKPSQSKSKLQAVSALWAGAADG